MFAERENLMVKSQDVVSAQRWRSVMPSFYFGLDSVGMASWED